MSDVNPLEALRGEERSGMPAAGAVRRRGEQRQRNAVMLRATSAVAAVLLGAGIAFSVVGRDEGLVVADPVPVMTPTTTPTTSEPVTEPSSSASAEPRQPEEPTGTVPAPGASGTASSSPAATPPAGPLPAVLVAASDIPDDQDDPWVQDGPTEFFDRCYQRVVPRGDAWAMRWYYRTSGTAILAGRREQDDSAAAASFQAIEAAAAGCEAKGPRDKTMSVEVTSGRLTGADAGFVRETAYECGTPPVENCEAFSDVRGVVRVGRAVIAYEASDQSLADAARVLNSAIARARAAEAD